MKTSSKILTALLMVTAVGVGVAGAQDVSTATSVDASARVKNHPIFRMHPGLDKLQNLSDDVKAQLKAAKEAGDLEKVKSILEANGITMPPKMENRVEKRWDRQEKRQDRRENRQERRVDRKEKRVEFMNLSEDVKAQLKAAFEAHDLEKVKSILAANGITPPGRQSTNTAQ